MAVFKDTFTKSWTVKFRYKNWKGEDKQHKKTGFKTQKEAKAYEVNFLDKEKKGNDLLFTTLLETYLDDCQSRLKPTTFQTKETIIRVNILPYFKKQKVTDITPDVVRKWETEMIKSPSKYSQAYLRTMYAQLSAIFNYGIKVYELDKNPCCIAGTMGNMKATHQDIWTLADFNQFIKALGDDITSKAMFTILFYSGCRVGELLALTLDDFDFNAGTLNINKNFAHVKGKDYIMTPKTTKSIRKILISKNVLNLVREYVFQLYDYKSNERLFPFTRNILYFKMEVVCKKSGVKKIRLHDIRHSHASLLMNMGTPIKQISERLGHENIQTTLQRYAHLYEDKGKELVDKLEELAEKRA